MHEEYFRPVPGTDTAVLFIHGIVGTPNHFRDLIPLVDQVPQEWAVYNVLLPGHGGTVSDFGKSSMKQWKKYVREVFEKLAGEHEKVIIVGHSMGTLFAMQLALERPEKVPFLFLLAVPMRPWLRISAISNSLRLVFGCIRKDHPREKAIQIACGSESTPLLWKYIPWVPRFIELFAEIGKTEKNMGGLAVPCAAWQSQKDELVSIASRKVLEKSGVEVHILPESSHFYYAPEDRALVIEDFLKRIEKSRLG